MIVTAMFPPIQTGTSFYSRNLAYTFKNNGHDVTVITVKNKHADKDEFPFHVYRIKALHINAKNYFKHLRFSSIYISNYRDITGKIKSNRIDVVILVNHYLDIAFPTIYATKKTNTPLYISVGTQMQSLNPFRNKILNMLDKLICGRLIFPFCTNIISWDAEIERYLKDIQRKRISSKSIIIPFGVNGNINAFEQYSHDYSRSSQIIGVGAIISQRDYLFQIRVFKEILKVFPNLKFKIIGHIYMNAPVSLVKELKIEKNVEFLGELPHDIVIQEMKNSVLHWMMLSGEYVGLGTATIEAMLLGVPSISNVPYNLFGNNNLVDNEHYIYTDGKNIENIKQKIIRLLLDEQERVRIGIGGREFIMKYLNWDSVNDQMINLFVSNKNYIDKIYIEN